MRNLFIALSIAGMALSGCAGQYTALNAGKAAEAQPGIESFGTGRYAYRFTLLNPETGEPWANHPYALTLQAEGYDLPFVQDEKDVHQGITDANGQTALIRFDKRLSDKDWDLQERNGTGKFGERFRLSDPDGKILAGQAYLVVVCSTPPRLVRGYTDKTGKTAYIATEKPENLVLHPGYFSDEQLPTSCEEEEKEEDAEYDPNDDPRVPRPASIAPSANPPLPATAPPAISQDKDTSLREEIMPAMKRGTDALQNKEYADALKAFLAA
jgi:hypothetical protein